MSKEIIKMYHHNGMEVSVVEINEKDREQSLGYFFETYEEAKADMEFQNRVNDVVGTHSIKQDIKEINKSREYHCEKVKSHSSEIMKHKDLLHKHIAKYNVFRRVSLITNSIIVIILLIIAVTG